MTQSIDTVLQRFQPHDDELIPILQGAQKELGYISSEAIGQISHFLHVSENQIYGVASFYTQFRFTPPGRHSIRVCLGTACHVRGGATLMDMMEHELQIKPGDTTPDKRFDLDRVACLGCCALSPVVQMDQDIHSKVMVSGVKELLERYE